MFPIRVQDDDQKLAGRTSPRSHSPICSRHSATQARRLCYHRLGVMPPRSPAGESSLLEMSSSRGTSCQATIAPSLRDISQQHLAVLRRTGSLSLPLIGRPLKPSKRWREWPGSLLWILRTTMGHTERRFWGDLPLHVAGAHPKGRRLRPGDVGPYVVAFMDQGPIERRSLLTFDLQGKAWRQIIRKVEMVADHERNYVTYADGDPV